MVAYQLGITYSTIIMSTELYALLLTDILVLVERHEERDKYYLRCYTVESIGGTKEELSPVIRLKDCLLRSAAADKGEWVVHVCGQVGYNVYGGTWEGEREGR